MNFLLNQLVKKSQIFSKIPKDDSDSFQIIFNVEEKKIFKAKNQEIKRKWMKQLQRVSINKFEGERELITNLLEQSYIIDNPQAYYLNEISKMEKIEFNLPNTQDFIEFSENSNDIKCATFDKLIEKLTNPQQSDNLFLYAFLLTFGNFSTSVEVLKKLIERYNTPPPSLSVDEFQKFKSKFLLPLRLRICQILKVWIINHASEFRTNKELYRLLNDFIKEMEKTKIGIGARQISKSIRTHVMKRDTFELQQITAFSNEYQELEQYSSLNNSPSSKHNSLVVSLSSSPSTPKSKYPKKLMNPLQQILKHRSSDYQQKINTLDIVEWDPIEIARQLILIEFKIFERIQPKECLNQAWNKENRENKAPNIHEMIVRTNK